MIESNDPQRWEVFARNEISMASLRFALEECERRLERNGLARRQPLDPESLSRRELLIPAGGVDRDQQALKLAVEVGRRGSLLRRDSRIALAQHDVDPGLLDMRTGYG